MSIQKNILRQEMHLCLKKAACTLAAKSLLVRDHLRAMDAFRRAWQSERLMGFVSMPSEVDVVPFISERSIIVPYCEADEIVPIRILSLNELEQSDRLKILEPKLSIRQDVSRRVSPEQIDVVLVPGLAFDRFGNRLGRGKGYYDRFLRRLPPNTLTIGLTFEETLRSQIPCDENDCPVGIVVTERGVVVLS
jgi:5-formyltetrahydrofolate cyclo-ligase